jgi:hypothetical protein
LGFLLSGSTIPPHSGGASTRYDKAIKPGDALYVAQDKRARVW